MSHEPSEANPITLIRLQIAFEQTQNALYAFEAVRLCLEESQLPPGWARDRILECLRNLAALAGGHDPLNSDIALTPKEAMAKLGKALGFSRPRQKNAFARLAEDAKAARAAEDTQPDLAPARRAEIKRQLMARENVAEDRAARIIQRGRRLITVPEGRRFELQPPGANDEAVSLDGSPRSPVLHAAYCFTVTTYEGEEHDQWVARLASGDAHFLGQIGGDVQARPLPDTTQTDRDQDG